MPRVKQTDDQRLESLKIKLEKAKQLKEKYHKQENALKAEITSIEEKERLRVMNNLASDPERLKSLFELGAISEAEYNALVQK